MGADVVGRNRKNLYFSRSFWYWRPLWDYCYRVAPDILPEEIWNGGHENYGAGLRAAAARALAVRLRGQIITGRAASAVAQHAQQMAAMPDETCRFCNGSGDHPNEARELSELQPTVRAHFERAVAEGRASICNGSGRVRPVNGWYELTEANISDFAAFLEQSGGFRVW
jgi:hypothetical protein